MSALVKHAKAGPGLLAFLLMMGSLSSVQAATYFVKGPSPSCTIQATNSGGTGASWASAFNNLDAALRAAKQAGGSNVILVAAGVYKPCTANGGGYVGSEPNLVTFKVPANTTIVGGFAGTGSSESQGLGSRVTTLSGDINGDDINNSSNLNTNKSDNAWHVVTVENAPGVTLRNLTIQGGYAAGPDSGTIGLPPEFGVVHVDYLHTGGGGMLISQGSEVTLNNVKVQFNAALGDLATILGGLSNTPLAAGGGGIAIFDEGSRLSVNFSKFDSNTTQGVGTNGGAINAFNEAAVTVKSSHFLNNTSSRSGGAMRMKDADALIIGSLFRGNGVTGTFLVDESGGGVATINSNLTVTASVFEENFVTSVGLGGGLVFHSPFDTGEGYVLTVSHCVFDSNIGGFFGAGGVAVFGNQTNPGTSATISNSLFKNNFAWKGGGLLLDSIPTTVTHSIFYRNNAAILGGGLFTTGLSSIVRLAPSVTQTVSNSVFKENSIGPTPNEFPPAAILPPGLPTDPGNVSFLENFALAALSIDTVQPVASLIALLNYGGAGVAVEFGATLNLSNSALLNNSAPGANGGGLLVWGAYGSEPGGTFELFNTNTVTMNNMICAGNTAANGNNTLLLSPSAGLLPPATYSTLTTDGSCP